MVRARLAIRIRALLSGSATGVPAWTPLVEAGSDVGLFEPSDAPWVVHADVATMVGGIRALLLQAMHPGSLAGVMQHSRYEEDALGRLAGTIRWLTICTFAARSAVEDESARVRQMHKRVRGTYLDNSGATIEYSAADEYLLNWVHIAFTDSFLTAHTKFGVLAIPGGADNYVRMWGEVVKYLGIVAPASSYAEMQQQITGYLPQLRVDDRTRRVVRFIQHPPFSGVSSFVFRFLFAAAYHSLPDAAKTQLNLRVMPAALANFSARLLLRMLRFILGTESPLEHAAFVRRRRLAHEVQS